MIPQSLFGRLYAALLAVIAVTVLIVAVLIMRERRELTLWGTASWNAARSIAETSATLGRISPQARGERLAALQRQPLMVEDARMRRPPSRREDMQEIERAFAVQVRRHLPRNYQVAVSAARPMTADVIRVESDRGPWQPPPVADGAARSDARLQARPALGPGSGPSPGELGRLLDVSVTLPDGGRVVFRTPAPPPGPPLPRGIFLQLSILTLVLGGTLFFMTRSITRPLSDLAAAADTIGRGGNHRPLAERGASELRNATRAFNAMQDRLRRYLDSRTRVLAAMSHDMRTSLTRLRLRVESIDSEELRERVIADVDEMSEMVGQALGLLKGLNDEEPLEPVDIDALLQTLQAEHLELGESVSIEGRTRGPLMAKPRALKRCLENLLQNAIKYGMRAQVQVADGAELAIRIRDEGPGISQEMLEQVFEPFFRVESSRNPDTGGSGLGLSIARDIAQAHGGTVALNNVAGGGLEAVLTLPRTV